MNKKWHLWRWLALASILLGIVLAIFQPTFSGSGNMSDFTWQVILLRFFTFPPICFFAFALLVLLLQSARIILRWLFTWRAAKWFLRTLVVLMVLVALFYVEENWRGKRAWENYKREWEAKGEKFDFASFIPPPVPDDQNFALTPIVASCYSRVMDNNGHRIEPENTNVVNRLKMDIYRTGLSTGTNLALGNWQKGNLTDLKAWQTYYRTMFITNRSEMGMPPPLPPNYVRRLSPDDTNATEEVIALATNEFPFTMQPQSPAADVLFALSKYDSAIEELRRASQLPFSRFPLNYTTNNPAEIIFPHWESLKSCSSVLRLRAIAELDDGQTDNALADVRLMLYLASSIRHEPIEESFELQMSLVNLAIQPVWEGLARRQWSTDQLATLEQDLAGIDAVKDYGFAMRAGLAFNLRSLEYLRMERTANSITDMNGDIHWLPTLAYRLSPSGWFYLNEQATAMAFDAALPTTADAEQRILSPEISERFGNVEGLERRWHLIPDNIYWSFIPPLPREAKNSARIQAGVDMARIACALERYRLTSGIYPEKLDALVPQYIEKIPRDIINCQPPHYRRSTDGKFILYSVGWDGKDDDGVPEDFKTFFQLKPAGDWVWQYPQKLNHQGTKAPSLFLLCVFVSWWLRNLSFI
jgi:hypothetical protein